MSIRPVLPLLITFAILTGCAGLTPEEQLTREMVGVGGKSPMFTNGYGDGCQSGMSAAGNNAFNYVKDIQAANNTEYKQGWEDGFRMCQSRQSERNRDNRNDNFAPYPYPWFPHTGLSIGVQL
jgi:hypothetical protein